MGEVAVALLLIGVLLVADPRRLEYIMDKLRELTAWLAE
jgi:hypothetical protein